MTPKNCPTKENLIRWFDGDADNESIDREHVQNCPACLKFAARQGSVGEWLFRQGGEEVGIREEARFLEAALRGWTGERSPAFKSSPAAATRRKWGLSPFFIRAAAGLLLAVGLGGIAIAWGGGGLLEKRDAENGAGLAFPPETDGIRYTNVYEPTEGVRIWSGADTVLSERSTGEERVLSLQKGGVFVDVIPGSSFEGIRTPNGMVRVLGTRFSVDVIEFRELSLSEEPGKLRQLTAVRVWDGRVEIENGMGRAEVGRKGSGYLLDGYPPQLGEGDFRTAWDVDRLSRLLRQVESHLKNNRREEAVRLWAAAHVDRKQVQKVLDANRNRFESEHSILMERFFSPLPEGEGAGVRAETEER